jgi:hypothetical protein
MLCAVVLAGCQGHAARSQSVSNVVTPSGTSTAAAVPPAGSANGAGGGADANGATDPAGAGVDSQLNAVDSQLSDLDSAMAQATQSPSDGG